MFHLVLVWAYVDPVTVLPATSIIATVVGVLMLCGKSTLHAIVRCVRTATMRERGVTATGRTHFTLDPHRRVEPAEMTMHRNKNGM